jgi:outer membrane murein-binding lipoprotein Lpp
VTQSHDPMATDGEGVQLRLDDGSIHHLPGADIHVLERAGDPADDLSGTVRLRGGSSAVKLRDDYWAFVRDEDDPPLRFRDRELIGYPVIGVCPGTPAAEAEKQPAADQPPVHVDNEAIVGGRYGNTVQTHEPRMFRSDGPEPPEDVAVLRAELDELRDDLIGRITELQNQVDHLQGDIRRVAELAQSADHAASDAKREADEARRSSQRGW